MISPGTRAVDVLNDCADRAKIKGAQERLHKAAKLLWTLEQRFGIQFIAVRK